MPEVPLQTTPRGFVRRRRVALYFVAAFVISWTGVLAIALPTGFPGRRDVMDKIMGPAFIAMALGRFSQASRSPSSPKGALVFAGSHAA